MTTNFVWEATLEVVSTSTRHDAADYEITRITYRPKRIRLDVVVKSGDRTGLSSYVKATRFISCLRLVKSARRDGAFKEDGSINAALDTMLSSYDIPFDARVKLMEAWEKEVGYMTKKVGRDRE